jgi:hypothetical protein
MTFYEEIAAAASLDTVLTVLGRPVAAAEVEAAVASALDAGVAVLTYCAPATAVRVLVALGAFN